MSNSEQSRKPQLPVAAGTRPKLRILIALLLLSLSAVTLAQTEVNWYSIDAGGGISSDGTEFQVIGIAGQSDTRRMIAGNLSVSGGYLPLPADTALIFKSGFE